MDTGKTIGPAPARPGGDTAPVDPDPGGPERPYHHGDLRRAVLRAALDAIAAEGPSAVSLRDLARRAGVSHTAPAYHFKDRTGLLTAIAAEGFGLLATALDDAGDPREAARRYVRFARECPAHFQVMFSPEPLREDDLELTTARTLACRRLWDAVSAAPAEGRGADAHLAGIAAWSLAHGFAALLLGHHLDGQVGAEDPAEVLDSLTGLLFPPPKT
ncbi:TetR/AcrR family transcriptional regulator [Streptomyces sp. NPDC127038]|uniref:TetR/AcrR family transcriptional regulator n=1 Tax=Streptomyces sp. NPDC127038 TaxID=3347114 RepID=UPI003650A8AF